MVQIIVKAFQVLKLRLYGNGRLTERLGDAGVKTYVRPYIHSRLSLEFSERIRPRHSVQLLKTILRIESLYAFMVLVNSLLDIRRSFTLSRSLGHARKAA